MAGIDKIYLTDYNEYEYFKNFLEKHEMEFFKKHKYSLLCSGLFDIESCYFKGEEIPVSNFCTEADVFIIQHLTEKDNKQMPNVVERLQQQYNGGNHGFDLIRQHKSEYDTYQIDRSGCKVKLTKASCWNTHKDRLINKTLRHIKREVWEQVSIYVNSHNVKIKSSDFSKYYHIEFDYFSRTIFNHILGCKYYKCLADKDGNIDQFLHNISMKQVYKYITRVRLKRNTEIIVCCCNYQRDNDGIIESITDSAEYRFVVV